MPLGAYSDSHSNARKIISCNNSRAIIDSTAEFGHAGNDNIAWWRVVTFVQWQELNSKNSFMVTIYDTLILSLPLHNT